MNEYQPDRLNQLNGFLYYVAFFIDKESTRTFYHFIGTESHPTENDISKFYTEIATDEEFKLPIEIVKELKYFVMTKEQFDKDCRPLLQ
jgi:hypothetical protein